jgi:hypothetical protein
MGRSSNRRFPSGPWRAGAGVLAALLLATLAAACTRAPDQSAVDGPYRVGIRTDPSPAELGENGFTFDVERDGKALPGAQVTFRMHMPGMPMSTDDVWIAARPEGKGRYAARGDFSMGGSWQVEVRVAAPDGGTALVRFPYEIKWELR